MKRETPTVLVCKMVPPGAQKLPPPIELVPGDTLRMRIESLSPGVDAYWESEFEAHIYMRIVFDYMEIHTLGSEHGTLFTEVSHSEEGQNR